MRPVNLTNSHQIPEEAYWLALQDTHWLISTRKVVRYFYELGSLRSLWAAPYSYLREMGLDDQTIRKFNKHKELTQPENLSRTLKTLEQMQVKLIRYVDKEYPQMLRNTMEDPPLLILHKGSLTNFDKCVAIVGTRNASFYGRMMARKLSKAIASKGYTIVSGLARGIDEWAHCGALEASRGRTVAVLAWMDPVYPSEHSELLKDIQQRGAVLSERLQKPFGKYVPAKFVQRNRITSGLSCCVIAVESDEEGGSIHQVKIALSQRRKVFALKPRNNERAKRGFKVFMDIGATPVKSSKEILDFLKQQRPSTMEEVRLDSFYQHSLDRFEKGNVT